jgi:undecaprenyl-diphosphatase
VARRGQRSIAAAVTLAHAIVLALLQGVTEFLPISSSGHLVLLPHLFAWPDQGLAFDEAVNTGTLVAVIAYFRRELVDLVRDGLRSLRRREEVGESRLSWGLVLGTVPVAVAGLLLAGWVGTAGRDPRLIAATSIGFGILLGWADRAGRRDRTLEGFRLADAVWVGLAQALALVPGTSRSGITMTAALLLGFDRTAAARFSFLLAVPVGLLVAVHDLWHLLGADAAGAPLLPVAVGFAVSAVSAYLVIAALLAWVRRQGLMPFAVYRVVMGLVILALGR